MSEPLSSESFNFRSGEFQMLVRLKNLPENITDDFAIIDLSGDLNLYSTEKVKECLNNVIGSGRDKIILDMQAVQHIDSSGLGAFLAIQVKLKKQGGFIKISQPSERVLSILELTKLRHFLKVVNSVEEGIS
ncbi:MAG: STAS domain-containing protein [Spirochaetota bacterium]